MKKTIITGIGIAAFLACCGIGFYYLENYEGTYYTQIDNTKITKLSTSDDMKYEYTIDCYDKNGKKKELKFKTSRELREQAYLKLTTRIFGVHHWEEVQRKELPETVQDKLK